MHSALQPLHAADKSLAAGGYLWLWKKRKQGGANLGPQVGGGAVAFQNVYYITKLALSSPNTCI